MGPGPGILQYVVKVQEGRATEVREGSQREWKAARDKYIGPDLSKQNIHSEVVTDRVKKI